MATTTPTDASLAALVALCRDKLAHGTSLSGPDITAVLDAVETLTIGQDNKAAAAVAALEAQLVTSIAAWVAVGAADSSAVRTTAVGTGSAGALGPLRTAATAAAAVTYVDIVAADGPDGR